MRQRKCSEGKAHGSGEKLQHGTAIFGRPLAATHNKRHKKHACVDTLMLPDAMVCSMQVHCCLLPGGRTPAHNKRAASASSNSGRP
jgi:hypothetical protein